MEQMLVFYCVVLIILSLILAVNFIPAFLYSVRLYFYLLKNNPKQFQRKTSLFGYLGMGGSNPFKWFPYIFNDEDTEDEQIKNLKIKIRPKLKTFFYMFTLTVALLILAISLK